ncbi:MAG: leucine-rich repeat domain-containing protein [Candidatus Hodarchaeota archaeon]
MPLTPKAIYEDLVNKDLDKPFAIELLLTLIDNAENIETRIESINTLNTIQVDDEKTFKFLEHLLISDLNEDIRNLTIIVLKNHYLDRALDPMVWALEHERSLKCKISIIKTIGEINTDEAKSVLIKKIKKLYNKENYFVLKHRFTKDSIENIPNIELAEILINYYVILFLKNTFGYIKYKNNEFGSINELDLSNVERYSSGLNKLENFLESIFSLRDLKKCDLRFNHLTNIPEIFNDSIEYLDLSYNKIVKLPDLQNFKMLKSLNLKSNRLRNLPESIGSLTSLEYLNLRNNMISSLPKSLSYLSSLKILDLHGNKLNSISVNLNKSILELEIGWNYFDTIPKGIKLLPSLERLGFGGNKLINLPNWIRLYHSLKQLELYDNKLIKIPESIGSLKSLERLNLRNNQLNTLPRSLINLQSLKLLNLSWNNFAILPEWIGSLSSLEELNLWGNQLESVPKSIASLSSLKLIDLNFNKIEEIPSFLKELEQEKGLIIKI